MYILDFQYVFVMDNRIQYRCSTWKHGRSTTTLATSPVSTDNALGRSNIMDSSGTEPQRAAVSRSRYVSRSVSRKRAVWNQPIQDVRFADAARSIFDEHLLLGFDKRFAEQPTRHVIVKIVRTVLLFICFLLV